MGPSHQEGQWHLLSHGHLEVRGNSEASPRMENPGRDWSRWVSALCRVFAVSHHFANITFAITQQPCKRSYPHFIHEDNTEGQRSYLRNLLKGHRGHLEGGFEPRPTAASPTFLLPPYHYLSNADHGQAIIPALSTCHVN